MPYDLIISANRIEDFDYSFKRLHIVLSPISFLTKLFIRIILLMRFNS